IGSSFFGVLDFVMGEIFADLVKEAAEGETASVFYGVFDRRKFQLTYCNVGQPLTIHYKAAENKIDLLPGVESPYKVGENQEIKLGSHQIDLNPSDKLILCSRGFLSLTNDEGRSWGLDEILSLVKNNVGKDVHGLRNEIFFQASKFSKSQPRDLTAIVCEVKERIMKLA
ncbi:MAG: SpoIIE family protein phosphatase, partial [Pseudomonadota bacterium]